MGPRRLREGRETAVTRSLVQLMPTQLAEHAVEAEAVVVQLERSVPWGSVWERNRERTAVSLAAAAVAGERIKSEAKMRKKGKKWSSIFFSMERSAWDTKGLSFY